jgi:hypothetical protein
MEEQVERLVNKVWGTCCYILENETRVNRVTDKYQDIPASKRLLIAVSGIPGSGTYMHVNFGLPTR